ncbi:PhzF family phenazine biosynthesis protein [Devosia sp. SD17-2]|uniref:PhzF family phenazine biosynthesis protein n=1 Tax=Devosia sp. SD17-2 TaxID=2976459 RepID=UPI0023D7F801|nr:PhzF family phenazine biosynthesis protein [Devosia sp. SD17-2]WEJ34773.1 PhzF family phenazine biosynthesis protein [Devosia sp. SD17-2]
MKLPYLLLDVFTRERFKGNPLAVVPKADGLSDAQMQTIAKEFNLSETVFLFKPAAERNTASLRIFTPYQELPFAGHPTIGSAVVLGLQHKLNAVRMEEKIGLVTALVDRLDKSVGEARFALPKLSSRVGEIDDMLGIAQVLGINVEDIGCDLYKPGVFSAGVPFHLVPVRNAEVLARLSVNHALKPKIFTHDRHAVYIFTLTPEEPDNDIAARMFGMGLGEDPGTGAAAAALIGLLAENQPFATGQSDFVLRQGHEMGRPCRITLQLRKENDALVHGAIGGQAIIVGEGTLDLGE